MEDQLMAFSGESPEQMDSTLTDTSFFTDEVLNSTMIAVDPATILASLTPYVPNYYHIAALSAKCLLSLLLCVLSATIKRDFLKIFALIFIRIILLDCAFDIYTEIKASITSYGSRDLIWTITAWQLPKHIGELQNEAVTIYQELLAQYTTYNIYSTNPLFALVSYIIADIVFWSTLFSSVVAFYYAHKAIVRPEEINYIPYIWSFLKVQLFPVLFTLIDTLLACFKVPSYVALGATAIIRLAACLVAFTLLTQMLASVIVFCRRRDDYTKASPYDQVRYGKRRLFSLILFQIVIQAFAVPYIIWSAVSLSQDFLVTFGFSEEDEQRLPLSIAGNLYVEHLRIFLIRSLVLVVTILVFIAPYRKKFIRFFCPCCRRD